ncbi:MAG: acylphosphatase [Bacteroidota bacterium]
MGKITRSIHIYGTVQGVGFRYATREKARNLGIKGRVKNMSDGSVYIEAQGEEEKMDTFIQWCHSGPSSARIQDVEIEKTEGKSYRGFDIIQ